MTPPIMTAVATERPTHACCPGSYDPATLGHIDIIARAAQIFDKVTVLVTYNPNKNGLFTPNERVELIQESLAELESQADAPAVDEANATTPTTNLDRIEVVTFTGLLVDWAAENGVGALVKGLRSQADYQYEVPMAQMNRRMTGVETVFLEADPRYGHVSSSLMKEVVRFGGSVTGLVPRVVEQALNERLR